MRGCWCAADGSVAEGAGLRFMDWPPHLVGSSARLGNILNVFTAPEFRGRGLARWLMDVVVEWCRGNGIDRWSQSNGRALYKPIGFTASNEMTTRLLWPLSAIRGMVCS